MKYRAALCTVVLTFFCLCVCAQIPAVDGTGTTITLQKKPQRIISLSPAATETLFAAGCGSQIIARTSLCTYPEAAQQIHVLGGFDGKTFSIEAILALQPDFVYGTAGMHDYVRTALAPFSIPVFLSQAVTINDIINELTAAGSFAADGSQNAQNTVKKIQWQRSAVKTMLAKRNKRPVRVYCEIWSNPPMSAGSGSFINDVITEAGGENICSSIPLSYPSVSTEFVVMNNPEVIIIPSGSAYKTKQEAKAALQKRGDWISVDAVANGRIIIADADFLLRCGPRIGDALIYLSRELYPELWNRTGKQ